MNEGEKIAMLYWRNKIERKRAKRQQLPGATLKLVIRGRTRGRCHGCGYSVTFRI